MKSDFEHQTFSLFLAHMRENVHIQNLMCMNNGLWTKDTECLSKLQIHLHTKEKYMA